MHVAHQVRYVCWERGNNECRLGLYLSANISLLCVEIVFAIRNATSNASIIYPIMPYQEPVPAHGIVGFSPASELITKGDTGKQMSATNPAALSGTRTKWFGGLNSIRFILAFIVVLFHCENPVQEYLRDSSIKLFQYAGMFMAVAFSGVAAVIAFFIISGFVIHYPNRDGIRDIKKFYLKRFIRVLGPLLVIMLLGIPFGNPERDVVWSLYCELIYYAIYPTLAKIKMTWDKKVMIAFAVAAVVVVAAGQQDMISLLTQSDRGYSGEFWQFGPGLTWLVGLPCWLLGVSLAERIDNFREHVSAQKIWTLRIVVYAATIVCCVLRFHIFLSYGISMLIMAVPIAKWLEQEILYYKTRKPIATLENFGKFSYSLYLCHPLIITALLPAIALTTYSYLGYIALCVLGAYVFYLLLEKPSHMLAEKLAGVLVKRA